MMYVSYRHAHVLLLLDICNKLYALFHSLQLETHDIDEFTQNPVWQVHFDFTRIYV